MPLSNSSRHVVHPCPSYLRLCCSSSSAGSTRNLILLISHCTQGRSWKQSLTSDSLALFGIVWHEPENMSTTRSRRQVATTAAPIIELCGYAGIVLHPKGQHNQLAHAVHPKWGNEPLWPKNCQRSLPSTSSFAPVAELEKEVGSCE